MSLVKFLVLCVHLGFHVVIGVGRLTVQFHHAYAIPSFLLDVVVRFCPVIVNSDCSHNSYMLHIEKTGPLTVTNFAADRAWRRRKIVLVLSFAFAFAFAFAFRLAFLEGVELLRAIRRQIHRLWCRAGSSFCVCDTVDLGFQHHPRGQPSTVEVKVLFQRSVWQHAKSNADTDVLWERVAARFLVAVDVEPFEPPSRPRS